MADATAVENAEEPAAPALSEHAQELLTRAQSALGDAIVEHATALGTPVIRVKPDAWKRAGEVCKTNLECDYLSFISVIDWIPTPAVVEEGSGDTSSPAQPKEQTYGVAGSDGRLQVFALVESTRRREWNLVLKTDLDDNAPHVDSWVSVYPGADWHERESWEMFGVVFDGHPSLRHIYLPAEFEGHPLRKDFPLLAREVKPWPGLVDVEPMPGEPAGADEEGSAAE